MPDLGDFMVTPTSGLFAWCIRKVTHSPVNHAAVYVGYGLVMEARPSGAGPAGVSQYPKATWSNIPLNPSQRLKIASAALDMKKTPYNFLDIAAQFFVRVFGWNAPVWALNRLGRSDRLQCAQLVDLAYNKGGVQLFPDARPMGLVAPSDLYDLIEKD